MTTIAVTMVRDEADIIGTTIAHTLASGVDHVIAADNLSTDDTRSILEGFGDRVTVIDDTEPGYYQSDKMSALARQASDLGAEWVLPFDADEFWYPTVGTDLSAALSAVDADVVLAGGYDHIARPDPRTGAVPGRLSLWRRPDLQKLAKVCFRAHPGATVAMGNHDVVRPGRRVQGPLEYRHFQYRTAEQMARKLRTGAEAYAASDVDERHGTHWREGGRQSDEQMQAQWDDLAATPDLVFDPAPILGRSVSVIIPTRDRASRAHALADTIDGAEVIVAEGDATFAENCNRGAREASGDVLVFLNDDTHPQPGWLDALVRRVGWGIAGAYLTNPDGTPQHSGVFFRRQGSTLEAYNRDTPPASGEVPAVTGAALAVDAALFEHLSGFDESFRNGYEDVDLCLRARRDGWRCFLAADSVVAHELSRSAGRFDHAAENVRLLNDRWGDLPV